MIMGQNRVYGGKRPTIMKKSVQVSGKWPTIMALAAAAGCDTGRMPIGRGQRLWCQ
jgi:hypothetical protein